jgi:N utilization substance protein A
MPLEEGIKSEKYSPGARFKFYLKSVEETSRGPKVIISRTHPDILRKLFKLEVPEIASGTVQIKNIAREAGSRSKIAVMAKEDNIDPIGSCVGQRGTRVQTIINEIGGEKIDIIEWQEDPVKFIAKALAPAKIIRVEIKGQEKKKTGKKETKAAEESKETEAEESEEKEVGLREAVVYVAADQLSLAIGREGQNVRLAAKLTGWKIDIVEEKMGDEGDKREDKKSEVKEEKKALASVKGEVGVPTESVGKEKVEEKGAEDDKKDKKESVGTGDSPVQDKQEDKDREKQDKKAPASTKGEVGVPTNNVGKEK